MRNCLTFIAFMTLWCVAMTLVGCDEKKFEQEYPVVAESIEAAETIGGPFVDGALHLPIGTTKIVIDGVEHALDTSGELVPVSEISKP